MPIYYAMSAERAPTLGPLRHTGYPMTSPGPTNSDLLVAESGSLSSTVIFQCLNGFYWNARHYGVLACWLSLTPARADVLSTCMW
jgi:hypothetical protein